MTCRRRVTGPRRHRCSAQHRDLVESYRLAVEAQNARAEAATIGYPTELASYFSPHGGVERRLTFREWLTHQAREYR